MQLLFCSLHIDNIDADEGAINHWTKQYKLITNWFYHSGPLSPCLLLARAAWETWHSLRAKWRPRRATVHANGLTNRLPRLVSRSAQLTLPSRIAALTRSHPSSAKKRRLNLSIWKSAFKHSRANNSRCSNSIEFNSWYQQLNCVAIS